MGNMYKPQNNGPHTELAATINAARTSITVLDASVLPDAPNVLTIGIDEDAELVELQSKTGNILTVQRGFNGTTPKVWESGAWIYRAITAQDIEELQERTKKIVKTLTAAEFEALTTAGFAALYESGVRVLAVEGDGGSDRMFVLNASGGAAPVAPANPADVSATLLASAWSAGAQTVTVAGVRIGTNGVAYLAQGVTEEQAKAAASAMLHVSAQSEGAVVITAFGTVPAVDIPIVIRMEE